jgi:hypothetical protein
MRRVPRLNMAEAVDATAEAVVVIAAETVVVTGAAAAVVAADADVTKSGVLGERRFFATAGSVLLLPRWVAYENRRHCAVEAGQNLPGSFLFNASYRVDGSQPRM